MEKLVELYIPNTIGSEKTAIEKAATIARELGFSDDRVEDLKTAVSEACINAIEHGNKFDLNTKVGITLAFDNTALEVTVHDEGNGIDPGKIPKTREEDNGFPKRRGYGIFLIRNLVNEVSFASEPGKGNDVKLIIHLENEKTKIAN
jgi:serine/threonine-protein kinase RsbW